MPAQPVHLLGAVWLPVTASILPRASDPHTGVSHGVGAARCCCVSYTTARPPWASLVKCLMRLSGNPANSLCPVSYLLTVTWPFLCRLGCARASSPFPSPGTSGTGVQGTPGTPGSMHPCVLGPRVWALLHTGPDWPRGGGEGGACLHLQIAPPPSTGEKAQKHQTSPPLLVPPDANHNLIALKQSCILRTRAQPRGRSRPYPRRVGLPEQDGAGSVTFPATYKSPERTRQGVSGDDEPWSLPAGRSAQSWWQWTVPRMCQLRLKGTLPARAISWFPSARRKSGTALDACGVRRL